MARRSASTTEPGEPAQRVINLRMDYPTFVAETAAMTADGPVNYPTERVSGHTLAFGRKNRLFGGLREAIIERDQQCTNPYCETPGRRCQVDHIIEYEDGGHTNETNAKLLCGPDNRQKHRHKRENRKRSR